MTTHNALGVENGKQELATPEQVELLKKHIQEYKPPSSDAGKKDLREPVRRIEQLLLTKYSGFLVGNQCLDFQKQDGVTEIEEAIMANSVERKLNDLVYNEETALKSIEINRRPIYVSSVSNFSNFLDLMRKTIRNLELNVPCVILSRSNTSQHSYRWTKLLVDLIKEHSTIDLGMITFLSCSLDDIKSITQSCQGHTGNLYSTCSRELASAIKSNPSNPSDSPSST